MRVGRVAAAVGLRLGGCHCTWLCSMPTRPSALLLRRVLEDLRVATRQAKQQAQAQAQAPQQGSPAGAQAENS